MKKIMKTKLVIISIGVLALSACSVTPTKLTTTEIDDRVKLDKSRLYVEQEKVIKPISFEEAMARSLKYNLDHRLKLMENALADGLLQAGKFDMLPNLMLSAGYTSRDFPSAQKSFSIVNGNIVEPAPGSYTGSTEANRHTYNIDFSWNILDFGVSYYRSKVLADQYLVAEERRRKVIQNIHQDVTSAYWRALGAQRLVKQADELMVEVKSTLDKLRVAQGQGIVVTKEALLNQRALLDTINLLTARRQELLLAKRELQALMNLEPSTQFEVMEIPEIALKEIPKNLEKIEDIALYQRPELRQEDLQRRITANETKKEMMAFFPNLSLTAGIGYDSNKYSYSNDWTEVGTKIGFNLFKLLSLPAVKDAREAQVKVDDSRRMALSMAILTQVRVAFERYEMALNDLDIVRESYKVDKMSKDYAQASLNSKVESEVEYIKAKAKALNTEFQKYQSYAAAKNAYGRLLNSLGMDFGLPEKDMSVEELSVFLSKEINTMENKYFDDIKLTKVELVPFHLAFDSSVSEDVKAGLTKIFQKANANLTQGNEGYKLTVSHKIADEGKSVKKAVVSISLNDEKGNVLSQESFSTYVNNGYSEKTLVALYQAAGNHALNKISKLRKQPDIQ